MKTLIVALRNMTFAPNKKLQEEHDKKFSKDNLENLREESELKIEANYSVQHAVFFGTEENLNNFGKHLTKHKISFKIE